MQAQKEQNDFGVLCEIYTRIVNQANFPNLSSEDRARNFISRLVQRVGSTSDAYIAWNAIQNPPPGERYNLLKEAAGSVGYGTWDCLAIKKHGHETGSKFD